MASPSSLLFRALTSILVVITLVGCGGGSTPAAAPTLTSSAPPVASGAATARSTLPPKSSSAPVNTAVPSTAAGNLGVYETEVGSTIELLDDGACNFQTTKGELAGCRYEIRGSNIQFSAGDGSHFAYIFSNGCIYAGKIGTEDHATFCKK